MISREIEIRWMRTAMIEYSTGPLLEFLKLQFY
jgi:hypothetical protein